MIPPVEERKYRICFNCVFWDYNYCNGPGKYNPRLRDDAIMHTNDDLPCNYNLLYDELVELFESGVIK